MKDRWVVSTGTGASTTFRFYIRDSNGTALYTGTAKAGTQAALAETLTDVTTALAGLTQTQIAGLFIDFDAVASLPIAVGGTSSWSVDFAAFEYVYTRTGGPLT